MTAQALDSKASVAAEAPSRKAYVVEKPRVPLVLKLFGLTALLIAIVVAVAIGITITRADAVAHETVNKSINGAAELFDEFEKQRLDALAGATQILGSDVAFYAYIQNALQPSASRTLMTWASRLKTPRSRASSRRMNRTKPTQIQIMMACSLGREFLRSARFGGVERPRR